MITIKVKLFSSTKDRLVGLIGSDKPEAVMFLTRFGIHTFGMKFPIDILVLDKDNKVVKIAQNLKPGNLFFWPPKFNKVIELPKGFVSKKKIKVGSKISLQMVK